MAAEIDALAGVREPVAAAVAIVGGSKVSTKLESLESLSAKVDHLILGGGIANTFLAASGVESASRCPRPDCSMSPRNRCAANSARAAFRCRSMSCGEGLRGGRRGRIAKVLADVSDEIILDIGPRRPSSTPRIENGRHHRLEWSPGVFEYDAVCGGTRRLPRRSPRSTLSRSPEAVTLLRRLRSSASARPHFLPLDRWWGVPRAPRGQEIARGRDAGAASGRRLTVQQPAVARTVLKQALEKASQAAAPAVCLPPALAQVPRAAPRSCLAPVRPRRQWPPHSMSTGVHRFAAWSSRVTGTGSSPGSKRAASRSSRPATRRRTTPA